MYRCGLRSLIAAYRVMMDLQALTDRAEITDLLTRYATAVDERDWEMYRTVFTPDAMIDYTSAGGIVGSLDEVVSFLAEVMPMFEATQHLICNVSITLQGDEATTSAMVFNPMKLPDKDPWFIGGWYHHELVRTSEGWRSRSLVEKTTWTSQGSPQIEA